MAVLHNGKQPALLPESMNPADDDTFYISWTDKLNGAAISSSTWALPANFTEQSDAMDVSITDISTGITYTDANSVTVTTTETQGTFTFSNTCGFSDGRSITRSLDVVIYSN